MIAIGLITDDVKLISWLRWGLSDFSIMKLLFSLFHTLIQGARFTKQAGFTKSSQSAG